MKQFILYISLFTSSFVYSQSTYKDSLEQFISGYKSKHEVVKGEDKQFLQFFPIDEQYKVKATFTAVHNAPWFSLPTSSGRMKPYRQYGKLSFEIKGKECSLFVYQSQTLLQEPKYRDYLFLPFTDSTTGKESYETGRYIDIKISDIKNNAALIDFNKAYNPYCAYISGYSCPIPPRENRLNIAIKVGEMKYNKHQQ